MQAYLKLPSGEVPGVASVTLSRTVPDPESRCVVGGLGNYRKKPSRLAEQRHIELVYV